MEQYIDYLYIIPAAFDPRVKDAVSKAVKMAAYETGVARLYYIKLVEK